MNALPDDQLANRALAEATQCVRGTLTRVKSERVRRSIKCVLVPATLDGEPVMVKTVYAKAPLWRWYLAREVEIYKSFEANGTQNVPKLYGATDSLMVRSRFVGRVLAEKRDEVMKDDASWREVKGLLRVIAEMNIDAPNLARDEVSSHMMRKRLLEDPDAPVGWVAEGFDRASELGIITAREATRLKDAVMDEAEEEQSFAHGDLLLRNIVRHANGLALIDWECAGIYLRGWDAALVSVWAPDWFRESLIAEDPSPRFAALRAWALIREINYRLKKPAGDAITQKLKAKLRAIVPNPSQ